MHKVRTLKPHLWLFLANLIYGINYTVAKTAMLLPLPPSAFVLLRALGAGVIFLLLACFTKREKIERADWPRILLCSFFGVVLNQVLFFEGLHRTSPINAGIIMVVTPVLVLVFTWIFLREKATLLKAVGVGAGLSGALLLVLGQQADNTLASPAGDIMVFINAASYAVYLVLVKPLMNKYSPVTIMQLVFLAGIPMILLPAYPQLPDMDLAAIPVSGWMAVLYVILFTTVLAYLLNTLAIQKVSPSVVGIYIYLQPLLAALIAVLSGTDYLRPVHLISSALIFTGVWLVSRPSRKL